MTCPHCNGEKRGAGFVMRKSGCGIEAIECSTCGGSGAVTAERLAQVEAGQRLREDRIGRGASLRQEAARLGIEPVELSRRERGKP
jgi:hypothetical protein